jgi:hypothetical protein
VRAAARIAALALLTVAAVARAAAPCPATFAAAAGACDERATPPGRVCTFPQGKCTCVRSVPCSGVPQPPGEPRWKCEAARTDGCPNAAPQQGAACKTPGKACSYGSCGSMTYTCAADKRTWFVSGMVAPPPAAARGGAMFVPPPPPSEAKGATSSTKPPPPSWKACPAGRHFGCASRSQGAAPRPGQQIPQVCGCLPTCPLSQHVLIASDAGGTWPDGSRKGRFTCSSAGLPSAAPRGPGF